MAKIFLVKESYLADKKVYFVKEDFLADEKVYVVKDSFLADYKAFEVKDSFLADIKVFRMKDSFLADSNSSRFSHSTYSDSIHMSSASRNSSDRLDELRNKIDRQSREIDRMMSQKSSSANNSESNSGCFRKIIVGLIFFVGLGGALKYFGLVEDEDKTSNELTGYEINTQGLNLRASPGTTGEIIKLMNQNDSIWQLNDSSQDIGSDTWIYVTDKVDTGWVNEIFTKYTIAMRKLEFAHYIYYNKKHYIVGSKGTHKSCIYCGSFYGDNPIDELRKGEIYQIPYCSRKCEIEDTESARIIDEYIKTCNIYKKQQAERDEKWDKEIEEQNKIEKRSKLLKRIFWI